MKLVKSGLTAMALLVILLAAPVSAQSGPPLWQVEDGDSSVYLLGTIHLLKEDTPWYNAEIEDLVSRADSLTVEVAIDQIEPMQMQQTMREFGFYQSGETLADNLPEKLHTRLMAEVDKAGLPSQAVERMKPWLAGIQLVTTLSQKMGFGPDAGAEATLLEKARARDIEVRELETFTEQMKLLAGLSPEAQRDLLRDTLDELENLEQFFRELKTAWLEGDLETIDEMLTEDLEANPELAAALFYERNRDWLPQIWALLDEPGLHLVAVGTGHLVGEDNVIALLREEGYDVARYAAQEAANARAD